MKPPITTRVISFLMQRNRKNGLRYHFSDIPHRPGPLQNGMECPFGGIPYP